MVGDPFNPADRPPIFNEANGKGHIDQSRVYFARDIVPALLSHLQPLTPPTPSTHY